MARILSAALILTIVGVAALHADAPPGVGAAWQALERKAAAIRPSATEVKWQQLPWLVDPNAALAAARAEKRPIFFWAAGGRGRDGLPLERC